MFLNLVVGLTLVMLCACNSQAQVFEEACNLVYKKLSSGSYEHLTKSIESFSDDDKQYHGCVIRLLGNTNKVKDTQRPDSLFGNALPYCPNGKLPPNPPSDLLNENGWCGDKMADGPGGTSYRVFKGSVFCLVEGRWDGGDDSDSTYVPSLRYEVIVKCADK